MDVAILNVLAWSFVCGVLSGALMTYGIMLAAGFRLHKQRLNLVLNLNQKMSLELDHFGVIQRVELVTDSDTFAPKVLQ